MSTAYRITALFIAETFILETDHQASSEMLTDKRIKLG